jgi:hypothetical protein
MYKQTRKKKSLRKQLIMIVFAKWGAMKHNDTDVNQGSGQISVIAPMLRIQRDSSSPPCKHV